MIGPALGNLALFGAAKDLDFARAMREDRRLDRAKLHRAVERWGPVPAFERVFGPFNMDPPARVLSARTA